MSVHPFFGKMFTKSTDINIVGPASDEFRWEGVVTYNIPNSVCTRIVYSRLGWIRTRGKFGQHKECGCYLNKSYSIQRTILLT